MQQANDWVPLHVLCMYLQIYMHTMHVFMPQEVGDSVYLPDTLQHLGAMNTMETRRGLLCEQRYPKAREPENQFVWRPVRSEVPSCLEVLSFSSHHAVP